MTYTVGVVDTTFSRVDMAKHAIEVIKENLPNARVVRYTVPGIKDIPLAAKRVLEKADIAMTLGWVGASPIDKYSYLASSMGIILVQILTGKHVVDVTVHEDEDAPDRLHDIAVERAREHALNVVALLKGWEALTPHAGGGLRQGLPDVGPLR